MFLKFYVILVICIFLRTCLTYLEYSGESVLQEQEEADKIGRYEKVYNGMKEDIELKEKNYNIEILRVMSCLMVIVIHVANYFCRAYPDISTPEYIYAMTFNAASRVSVPCFFMISGALLLGREETLRTCWKRAAHMFAVLTIWNVIYYLFNTYYTHQECSFRALLSVPAEAHLWYLYVLVPLYLMLPFLQSMVRGMNAEMEHGLAALGGIWMVLLYLASFAGVRFYYDLPILGGNSYLYYFYMGYYLKKNLSKIQVSAGRLAAVFVLDLALIVGASAVASSFSQSHVDDFLKYGNPLMILNSAAVYVGVMKLGGGSVCLSQRQKNVLELWAGCSFGIYLFHIILLDIYKIHTAADAFSIYWILPVLSSVLAVLSLFFVFWGRKFLGYFKARAQFR